MSECQVNTARTATYFLEHQPTTFDVVHWICTVKSLGFESVSFHRGQKFQQKQDYPEAVSEARLANILRPLCALAGFPIVEGIGLFHKIFGRWITHLPTPLVALWHERGSIWRFPYHRRHEHITVTIRESWRNQHRNSNRPEWDKFIAWAENHGERVIVLEDREENPISIEDRADLYNCKMNLAVVGGPIGMCWTSTAPHLTFGMSKMSDKERLIMEHSSIPYGSQHPWATPHQRLVWEPDDFDVIVREFSAMLERP